MKIVVCIKQVPDTTEVRIDPVTHTLVREGVPSIINPFDENAIEAGLELKEKYGGTVIVISMGPPQVKESLKEAIAMGVDETILVSDRKFAGADTWATSYTLSKVIEKIGDVDIIFFGKQAIDGDTAQVGPGVAENLNLPQVAYIRKIDVADNVATVERVMEDGHEVIEVELPAVFTVLKEINEPRLPSLRGKMKARKAEIPVWTVADLNVEEENLGLDGSPTFVSKVFTPEPRGEGEIIQGSPEEQAAEVVKRLREVKLV